MESSSEQHLDPDGLIYLVGGYDGKSWLSSLDSYSVSKDIIKSLKKMPSIRSYTSLATLNGNLYVIGGGYAELWYNTGMEVSCILLPFHLTCSSVLIYLCLVEVDIYNPANDDWSSLPCLNEQKGGLAATTFYDKIFAIGGGNGVRCFSDVEMFDIDVGRWISARSMHHKVNLLLIALFSILNVGVFECSY